MDQTEFNLRTSELRLSRRSALATSLIAGLSFIVSAAAVVISVTQAAHQAKISADQFNISARAARYNDIVGGLASSAAAVQQNSMRLLVDYVQEAHNFANASAQQIGARDAIQIFTAFIEDNSTVKGRSGLSDYESPQPIILSRAIDQLVILSSARSLGSHSTDISRGDFHGVSLPYFTPNGSLLAIAADFRSANLTHLNLDEKPASLNLAFFTCASLQRSNFGKANLSGADLSGANLNGTDLSRTNVKGKQLRGVTISSSTRLPPGVVVDASAAWGSKSAKCHEIVDDMTGMHGGQGYLESDPCPMTAIDAARVTYRPPFAGDFVKLAQACTLRAT